MKKYYCSGFQGETKDYFFFLFRYFAENLENVYDILMMELKYFTALRY